MTRKTLLATSAALILGMSTLGTGAAFAVTGGNTTEAGSAASTSAKMATPGKKVAHKKKHHVKKHKMVKPAAATGSSDMKAAKPAAKSS
jgi:hypothetical protein